MPRGARGELVALEEHDVFPAHVGQVIGHGAADHSPPDDDDTGTLRQVRYGHGSRGALLVRRGPRRHRDFFAGRRGRRAQGGAGRRAATRGAAAHRTHSFLGGALDSVGARGEPVRFVARKQPPPDRILELLDRTFAGDRRAAEVLCREVLIPIVDAAASSRCHGRAESFHIAGGALPLADAPGSPPRLRWCSPRHTLAESNLRAPSPPRPERPDLPFDGECAHLAMRSNAARSEHAAGLVLLAARAPASRSASKRRASSRTGANWFCFAYSS